MDSNQQIKKILKDFGVLSKLVLDKNPQANLQKLKKAIDYAKKKHEGVTRASGEKYICHPVAVCLILLENNIAETNVLCASLLHDVVEDTDALVEDLRKEFDSDIANIVANLTKIDKEKFESLDEYNSENLRKIILATAKDVRVMFIKLADRLHNMRTLSVHREDKQKRIANQTFKVYAPIAEKLGIYSIKSELEDLSFLYLNPEMFQYLSKNIELTTKARKQQTKEIVNYISEVLKKNKINFKILGRAKHYYSIYKKVLKENKTLDRIYDLYGIRIIVDTKEDCYHVKHLLEDIWNVEKDPETGAPRIKDYIQKPKANGYQSLHINFRYEDKIIEVQVRTKKMDEMAESGVAKHWKYKANQRDKKLDRKIDLLRQALAWKFKNKTAAENFKIDIFGGEIVCITPKGDPVILKEGSTPLDFAYSIHTKVGDHYESSIVNGKVALMTQTLNSGDIVSINTSKNKSAAKQWLNIVVSPEAKSKLRQSLKMGVQQKAKKKPKVSKVDFEEFQLANKIEVIGKSMPVKLSKCCTPKFGDEIVGYKTKDKKITIHSKNCPNRFTNNQNAEIKVQWVKEKKPNLMLYILSVDETGILGEVLDILLKKGIDVLTVSSEEVKRNILMSLVVKKGSKVDDAIKTIKAKEGILEVKVEA